MHPGAPGNESHQRERLLRTDGRGGEFDIRSHRRTAERSAVAANSFAGSVATVGAVEVLGNWFPPDGFRDCGRIAIGNCGTLDIGNRQLDARIVRFNVDFKRSEAYLHCSGFSGRLGCEVVFGGDALANPNSQSYKLIDGLGDCDGQLENLCPINCGFTLAAAGGTICAARNGPHSFADVTAENLPQGLAAEELRRDRLRRRGAAEGEGHRRTNCGAKR
ncbi:MAG: hypothetical protein LBI39_04100 [Puniceicoccales bacterium]|nr:hypothetical protein [Puniceicoccales bacterium]